MQPDELYHLLEPRPFRPVRVYLTDGRTYDIPRRDMAVVGMTYLDIGLQAHGYPEGICASVVTIGLKEISRVERLSAPA
jgi:hypothetical protein